MEGWIKLHRRFLSWEWFDDSDMIKLFLYLLLSANHEDRYWKGNLVKRGQLITGLSSLSKNTKLSIRTIRTCLTKLEKTQEIDKQSDNRFSVITICNYDSYQSYDTQSDTQSDKQATSKRQASDNKQEYKNKKNERIEVLKTIYFEKHPEIDSAFKDYLKLRINSKYTMTDRAINALVKKLRELSSGNKKIALEIIDNAILGKWKSFYQNKE